MPRTLAVLAALVIALASTSTARAEEAKFSEASVLGLPPAGKHFRFSRDQAAPKGFSAKDRLVATYYFYWYDDESGAHFRNPDGSDALTDHPVDPKGYSYKSAAWHKKQMEDMIDAGIDLVLPVFWGCPADRAAPAGEAWSYAGLPALVAAQEELLAQGRTPPRIGMFYDTSTLQYNAAGRRVDLSKADGRAWFYVTVRDFFSLVPPKLWATVEGRPIVFLYAAAFASGGTDDPAVLPYVRTHFADDFGGAQPQVVAERSWRLAADSTYAWGAAFGLQVMGVAAVGPGYDDHAVPGRTTPKVDRENGAFYRRNWERLLAMDLTRRPRLVAIETWNELHEGTDIAESREYGRRYIELTKSYAASWKAGERRKPVGPYAQAKEISATFGSRGKSEGLRLKTGGDGEAAATAVGGVDCLRTLPNRFSEGKYLYFEVDDSFYFDTGGALEVTVEYLDEGTAPLELHYDSADASAPVAGAYKSAGSVARQGSGSWKRAGFTLTEARLVNRQNLASDFRLYTPSGVLTVRCVAVRRID
jgi:hypothetical protein